MAAAAAASAACSSDEVVDLGQAEDLDEATSKLFFSDGDVAGAVLSWPAAKAITSTLTDKRALQTLCDKHKVPREYEPVCAGEFAACQTPPAGSNAVCIYSAALEAGLRFPLHDFYARVLRHYRLAPSQLAPNAWSYLAAFVLRCQDAGVEPLVSAFSYFFNICTHRYRTGEPAGWHHFQPYTDGGRRLFMGTLPSKSGWRSKFFFLKSKSAPASGWNCPVRWGKPSKEKARKVELTFTSVAIEKLKQMACLDFKSFLAVRQHELPVGAAPLTLLQTTVKEEAPRDAAAAAESAARKRKSPAVAFTSSSMMNTPPQSFLASTPAPPRGSGFPFPHARAAASIGGGSGLNTPPPHMMFANDSVLLWDAIAERDQLRQANASASNQIVKLNEELRLVRSWNAHYQEELRSAEDKHARLTKEYIADRTHLIGHLNAASAQVELLKSEHAAAVAQLKEEHAAENAQLKQELEADNAQLREEHAAEVAYYKKENYAMGVRDMRQLALRMFPNAIDPSELRAELLLKELTAERYQ